MQEANVLDSNALIAADRVTGTNVYDTKGEKLGSVYDVMIDKASGRAVYAVMSFGGFLGIGEKYHPLPWSTLKYDTRLSGYVVDLDKDRLNAAPYYGEDESINWPEYGRRVDEYYDVPTYWR